MDHGIWRPARRAGMGRRGALGAIAAGSGALWAACAKRGSTSGAASSTGAAAQPKVGGTLNLRAADDPYDWDITNQGKSPPAGWGIAWAYNSVLGFKAGPQVKYSDLEIQPELAERWETPDAQTYIYHLRPGVQFASLPPVGGRPLVSADVKWSYEYSSRTGPFKSLRPAQYSSLFEGLQQIDTPDDQTATVRFNEPFAPFLSYSAWDWNPIFPHEIYDQEGSLQKQIVGSGAWQLDTESSQKGSHWVWKRNPSFWLRDRPYIDEIQWIVLVDEALAQAAFKTGQVDAYTTSVGQDAQTVKSQNPGAVALTYPDSHAYLYINNQKAPLNDVRVRRALSLAIDRDEVIKVFTAGNGLLSLAGAEAGTYSQAELKQLIKYDPQQAQQLLAQAGYPNGVDLEVDYYGNTYVTLLQIVQAQLKKVGINLNLNSLDQAAASSRRKNRQFQLAMNTKGSGVDIDTFLYEVFYPDSKGNYGAVNDPTLTAMLVAQRREVDATKRNDIVRQAVRYIYDNAFNLSLCFTPATAFWNPSLKNYAPNDGNDGFPVLNSWLAR